MAKDYLFFQKKQPSYFLSNRFLEVKPIQTIHPKRLFLIA